MQYSEAIPFCLFAKDQSCREVLHRLADCQGKKLSSFVRVTREPKASESPITDG